MTLRSRFLFATPAILVVALLAAFQLPAPASHSAEHPCDLIASTHGLESNSGLDETHPLRNVQTLVERLEPGETGCLRGTTAPAPFSEDVVIQDKNPSGGDESDRITLMSYPGEVAKIRGHLAIEDSANRITVKQLVLEGTAGGATARLDGDDLRLTDNNITGAAACVRVGVMQSSPDLTVRAERVGILRNRIHDCGADAINLGRTQYANVQTNLIYDNTDYAVRLTPDADATFVYRNIIDGNGHGVVFFGADSSRFSDTNFIGSNIISRSTTGWNIGYSLITGPAGNWVTQTCVYSPTNSNGGLRTTPAPPAYQIWAPPLQVSEPVYKDRSKKDFRPASPSDPCFRHSGDVASVVDQGGGPNDEEASADNPKPNILLIVTDDQRADGTLTQEAMPQTVNRLKNAGVDFTNAYTTTPICCPARASIMTGQYAHNHEVPRGAWGATMRHESSLQAYLQQRAAQPYRTGLFGKFLNNWVLDNDPEYWDEWSVGNDGYCPFMVNEQGTRKRYPPLDPATGGPPVDECAEGDIGRTALAPYTTDYLRDQAVEFLEHGESDEATDSKPWFLYVAPFAPHRPHTAEADYANLNFPPYTWNPATFEDTSDKPPGGDTTTPAEIFGSGSDPGRRVGQLRALRSVDDMVGTLLDELKSKGEQDTLVLYVSDNGYLWGEHGLTEKSAPYLDAAKVPLLMKYAPLTTPGQADPRIVANIDLMPTALGLAGISPLPGDPPIDGQSLIGTTTPRQRIHTEFYHHDETGRDWFATRAPGDYLYIEYYAEDGETIELRHYYDLETDPYELTNLYGPDGQPGTGDDLGTPQYTLAELHDRLRRDRFCKGAECPPGPGGGTVDVKPPRTSITAPAPDSTVCCRVKLAALAHDNVGIDHVEFRVDGNLIGTDSSHPYSVLWENTGAYATGSHLVEAIAVDSSAGANSTVAGSPGSFITVNLDGNGSDIQIDDGGVPRTSCGTAPSPCNVGTLNPGDTIRFSFPSAVAPGSLIPGWDGNQPAACTGDPPALGCVTVSIRADSKLDQVDNDILSVHGNVAGTSPITALGEVDLGDFEYVGFDTGLPFRTWPHSPMRLSPDGRTVIVTLGQGTGPPGGGASGTAKWTRPSCNCQVWESIDGTDTDEDREF